MAASLRGQLGVKSSPLSPTSSKLTTQMLVLSHMDNHYKKISKAKPAIDNGPPKSMVSSQKLRDRRVRKHVEKYGSRPTSRLTYRPGSTEDLYNEQDWEEPEDDEECQVRDIMRNMRVPLKTQTHQDSVDATAGSRSDFGNTTLRPQSARMMQTMRGTAYTGRPRPMSARSTTSVTSNYSHTSRGTNPLKVTYNGDVLNKHAHNFTEPAKPFTPRTLKSNRESSLKRYKYYTPPARKTPSASRSEESFSNHETQVKELPKAKPRRKSWKGDNNDLGATETLTETMLMDMSLQSHDPRQRGEGSDVPRLDISMDKDHLMWMQEQASRAQIRARNNSGSNRHNSAHSDGGDTLEQTGTLGETDTLRFTRTASTAKSFGIKSPTSHRLDQAEQEQKYVTFAHEVTQDIVSRGISSDKVLHKVFENHVDRKKGELDERRLRAIVNDIRRDLGVQNTETVPTKTVQYSEDLEEAATIPADTLTSVHSAMSATSDTYHFERTTDVMSTIRSERDEDDDDLKQYQMNLTVKGDAEEENSVASEDMGDTLNPHNGSLGSTLVNEGMDQTLNHHNGSLGSTPVNGGTGTHSVAGSVNGGTGTHSVAGSVNGGLETRSVAESENVSERGEGGQKFPTAPPRHRAQQYAGSTDLSRQPSVTDTEPRTEHDDEEVEEEVEEEYEDDYDADDDDNQEKASDDDF